MIVVQFRVALLHRVPISTHLHFYKPLYIYKILQTLQILQILQTYRFYRRRANRTGRGGDFRAPCTGCCIAAFRRAWKSARRRPRVHKIVQELRVFGRRILEKVPIGKLKKSGDFGLAHSVPRPDQFYGLEPCCRG